MLTSKKRGSAKKNNDPMLDDLRKIRKKMTRDGIDFEKLNLDAQKTLAEFGITLRHQKLN